MKEHRERAIEFVHEKDVTEFNHTFYSGRIDALSTFIPSLELLLSDKPTVAITETAHCANTLLSECADSKDGQVIGVVGAGSSETEIVKQNEQTKEHNICDIPGCHKIAPKNDIFCADHRY